MPCPQHGLTDSRRDKSTDLLHLPAVVTVAAHGTTHVATHAPPSHRWWGRFIVQVRTCSASKSSRKATEPSMSGAPWSMPADSLFVLAATCSTAMLYPSPATGKFSVPCWV